MPQNSTFINDHDKMSIQFIVGVIGFNNIQHKNKIKIFEWTNIFSWNLFSKEW